MAGSERQDAIRRERFIRDHEEARRPVAMLASSAAFLVLASIPVIPGLRDSAPAPLAATATWAILAVASAWIAFLIARRSGVGSRAYRYIDDLDTVIFAFGPAVLVGVGGRATSIWWLVYFAAAVFTASAAGRRRFNGGLILSGALLAVLLLAARAGASQAFAAIPIGGMGIIAWWVVASSTERQVGLQAERDALQERVRALEAERARRHLARELHDGVGSALALAALYGDVIERGETSAAELVRLAAGLRDSAKDGLHDLRSTLDTIDPSSHRVSALGDAMRQLAHRFRDAAGVEIVMAIPADTATERLDAATRLTLLRVFQEATQNAVRHGAAKRIEVSLATSGGGLLLSLADDGRGIDPGTREGRGMSGMRRRAAELGGSFAIERNAMGRGTVVRFQLPTPA